MTIFLSVLLAALIVAGMFMLLRYRKLKVHRQRPAAIQRQAGTLAKLKENESFWGAELSKAGCDESRALLGKQFPFEGTPVFPLPGCTQTILTCTCEFRGLRNRRVKHRRVTPDRRTEVRFDKTHPDRRANAGRRRGDRWVHHAL